MVGLVVLVLSSFLTFSEFALKYGVSYNAVTSARYRYLPAFAIDSSKKPYLLNEQYCIQKKAEILTMYRETILDFRFLSQYLSLEAITRLCILSGADVGVTYGAKFFRVTLFVSLDTSILAHVPPKSIVEFWMALAVVARAAKFIGSFDEDILADYLSNIFNVDIVVSSHEATCVGCGETRYLKSRVKNRNSLCSKCSIKKMHKNNIKSADQLKRYWYFCPTCPSVRAVVGKRKSPYCIMCSKLYGKTLSIPSQKPVILKTIKKKKTIPREKVYSQVGTDGAKINKVTVKLQVVDFETMETPVRKREDKTIPQTSREAELSMQEAWLTTHQVTTL